MRLAIPVVYLVADRDDERLLEVHLDQIARNTPEPYLIYAAANRLPKRVRQDLRQRANVKVCDLPATDLRGGYENAYYLELLVKSAIDEGATHICTLHLDSFPVRRGWATELAGKLRGDCVVVGLERDRQQDRKPMSAFMLFAREFYLAHHPEFQLPEGAEGSADYQRYREAWPHIKDSGVGYGFKMFTEGLSWYPLVRTDRGGDGWGFGIFGDRIFHLGGGLWFPNTQAGAPRPKRSTLGLEKLWGATRWTLPGSLRARIGSLAPKFLRDQIGSARVARRKTALVASPERFLRNLGIE